MGKSKFLCFHVVKTPCDEVTSHICSTTRLVDKIAHIPTGHHLSYLPCEHGECSRAVVDEFSEDTGHRGRDCRGGGGGEMGMGKGRKEEEIWERGEGRRVGWRLTGAGCDRDEVPRCRASITTSGSDVIDSVLHYI